MFIFLFFLTFANAKNPNCNDLIHQKIQELKKGTLKNDSVISIPSDCKKKTYKNLSEKDQNDFDELCLKKKIPLAKSNTPLTEVLAQFLPMDADKDSGEVLGRNLPKIHSSNSAGDCDSENQPRFDEICRKYKGVHTEAVYVGTDYPGTETIDCEKGTLKRVMDRTGETFTCNSGSSRRGMHNSSPQKSNRSRSGS